MAQGDANSGVELLSVKGLISAYQQGYFPMDIPNHHGEYELIWLCPDPRTIINTAKFHLSRSMSRVLVKQNYVITYNQDFRGVIHGCAAGREDTWLTPRMIEAYSRLHDCGYAHSVEVYCDDQLSGGVYGVKIAKMFFAESMFHLRSNMSKVALWALNEELKRQGHEFFDCQFMNSHLKSLGAEEITQAEFLQRLRQAVDL